jgi:hypothetical protein
MIHSREEFDAHLRFGVVTLLGFSDLPNDANAAEYFGNPFVVGIPPKHERMYPPQNDAYSMRCARVLVRDGSGRSRDRETEYVVPASWVLDAANPRPVT